ncbi:MAG: SpoIID/LytB domain-containing protein [Planctomycetota bacterium]|nr:SpoIID/LytB domain-containing protein [Planctomycetota bacterium]
MRAPVRPESWLLALVVACALLMMAAWAASPARDPWKPAMNADTSSTLPLEQAATLAALHGAPVPTLEPVVPVRLMAFEGESALRVTVRGAWEILDENGLRRADGHELDGFLRADPTGVQVGAYLCGLDRLILAPAGDGALRIENESYTGALEVGLLREGARAIGLSLVLHLPLEDYVLGVVCGEMPTSAAGIGEALRAQAVAARPYALWQWNRRKGALRDTASDQVFRGLDWHTAAAREAVEETRGLVLTWQNELLSAFFHAECGGSTADAAALGFVRKPVGALSGAPDPGCEDARRWTAVVSAERLDGAARALNLGNWMRGIHAIERDDAGRMLRTRLLGDQEHFDGPSEEARVRLGVPSTAWTAAVVRSDGALELAGRGRGHGIGLCQNGARRRSKLGENWRQILAHYFPGAGLQTLTTKLLDA